MTGPGVPGAKERHLLAVLAAAYPALVTVDRLLEALWDGAPPRTGRKSLQAHVVRLRTALEPDRPRDRPGGTSYAATTATRSRSSATGWTRPRSRTW